MRDCEKCKHYVIKDTRTNWDGQETTKIYGCDAWECDFKSKGMTIEEHITQLKKLKSFHNGSYGASINFALDTMRKYQKIKNEMADIGKELRTRFDKYKADGSEEE